MTEEADDLLFRRSKRTFNVRASGLLVRGDKALFHCSIDDDGQPYFALVGGKVKFGESAVSTIEREYREELHIDVRPKRLLWVMEHQFGTSKDVWQQVNFVHLLDSPQLGNLPNGRFTIGRHTFEWISLKDFPTMPIYPAIVGRSSTLPAGVQYVNDIDD